MLIDTLQKELIGLGEDDLNLLISFARFLRYKTETTASSSEIPVKRRKIGFLSEAFISIASIPRYSFRL